MTVAAAAAVLVTSSALAACPVAASAEPALKPNQPNQRRPRRGPSWARHSVCGRRWLRRRPIRMAATPRRRDPRADVHHGAACEVDGTQVAEPAAGAQTQWASGE